MTESKLAAYEPPTEVSTNKISVKKTDRDQLLRAFLIAPVAAPIVFSVITIVGGLIVLRFSPELVSTPIGLIVVPVLALSLGLVISYGLALMIGLPVVLLLRRAGKLNGWTIHGTAFICVLVPTLMLSVPELYANGPPRSWLEALQGFGILVAYLAPGALVSGTTFWWLMRRSLGQPNEESR